MDFSPDSWTLAIGLWNGTIKLWDLNTHNMKILKAPAENVRITVASPDGHTLASGCKDGTIHLWDKTTGKTKTILEGHTKNIDHIVFSSDGKILATGDGYWTTHLWDTESGQTTRVIGTHTEDLWSLALSPDGRLLAAGGRDAILPTWNLYLLVRQFIDINSDNEEPIGLYDTKSGKLKKILLENTSIVNHLAFSPDGKNACK